MKTKDWQNAAKLIRERDSHAATADSGELSSFSLSKLPVDECRPPTVLQGPYIPLSTSTPIHMPQGNQQTMDSVPDKSPFQQVIPSIPQQSLYPLLAALQTHLIIEPNWAEVTDKAKNLEHIVQRCDPPATILQGDPPILQGSGEIPGLYSHIAQSQDQDSDSIPRPFKSTKSRGGKK